MNIAITSIIFSILITIIFYLFNKYNKLKKEHKEIDYEIDKYNLELKEKNKSLNDEANRLKEEKSNLSSEISLLKETFNSVSNNVKKETDNLELLKRTINDNLESQKEISKQAYDNYCMILNQQYKEKEEEQQSLLNKLDDIYFDYQNKLLAETSSIQEELEKIRSSRAAAIQAQLREKEIEDNSSFYCLTVSDIDKLDISKLETVKTTLSNPRILSMLIWQTYFQKQLKAKTAEIIGTSTVTGIYKITNIITKQCYIGQAVNIATRWTEHVKCGLGIDTPVKNKLYKAIQEYGIYNFSFELLEACPQEQLNEKEKYYISLYDSYNYGYNSNSGVSK